MNIRRFSNKEGETSATLQAPSPEFADLPTTELGVPVFSAMTDEQKRFFLKLCGAEI